VRRWSRGGASCRRMAEQRFEVITLSQPRWNDTCADGRIEIVNLYNGDPLVIEHLALLTYAKPRTPSDELAAPLRASRITFIAVGDGRAPQEMLFATASGHAAKDVARWLVSNPLLSKGTMTAATFCSDACRLTRAAFRVGKCPRDFIKHARRRQSAPIQPSTTGMPYPRTRRMSDPRLCVRCRRRWLANPR
jgi:hypothetical protein